jgi:arginine deiminase
MACNVLAVRPRVVVMLDGSEISLKGDGGPTCLTAPLWRE